MTTELAKEELRVVLGESIDLGNRVEIRGDFPVASGAFGAVWQGLLRPVEDDSSPTTVALKFVKFSSKPSAQRLQRISREVYIWTQLEHPNILPFLGLRVEIGQERICMVSPWQSNGHAIEYLKTHYTDDKLGHVRVNRLIYGVVRGLNYLHGRSPPVVHGDLKGSNVLVDADGCALLCDFGLSSIEGDVPSISGWQPGGTLRYMAPERIEPEIYGQTSNSARTPASDVYSFGMTVYEIMSGDRPFSDYIDETVVLPIRRGERPPDLTWRASQEGVDTLVPLMKQCWNTRAAERPTVSEIWSMLVNSSAGVPYLETSIPELVISADEQIVAADSSRNTLDPSELTTAVHDEQLERPEWAVSLQIQQSSEVTKLLGSERFGVDKDDVRQLQRLRSDDWDLGNRVEMQGTFAVAEGSVGDVWKGLLFPAVRGNEGVKQVALKMLRVPRSEKESDRLLKRLVQQVSIWSNLDHENILPFLGTSVKCSLGIVCLVSPWQRNGHVMDYLQVHYTADSEGQSEVFRLIFGIANGVAYLHQKEVMHGDLKGSNVLVDNAGEALLADFGLSQVVESEMEAVSGSSVALAGSYRWMAPERLDPLNYGLSRATAHSPASDLYSLGMTMYEILSGDVPFGRQLRNEFQVINMIHNGDRPPFTGIPWRASDEMMETFLPLIHGCTESQPKHRPSAEGVLLVITNSGEGLSVTEGRVSEITDEQLPAISLGQLSASSHAKVNPPKRVSTPILHCMLSFLSRRKDPPTQRGMRGMGK